MKQITQSPADLPYSLVNFGVDTLVLNVRYADENGKPLSEELDDWQVEQFNGWQAIAKEQEEPAAIPRWFRGAQLQIYAHGAGKGQWRWILACPAFKLYVGRGRLNGIVGQVRFSAAFLWSNEYADTHRQDLWQAVVEVSDFIDDLFASGDRAMHLQVSELHLCADLAGWDVSECDWRSSFVSRSRRLTDRSEQPVEVAGGAGTVVYSNRRLATLEFGSHGAPLSCSIYNKSLEIKVSDKDWFQDIWRAHGWDGSSEVWRVEFRWKREALHEIKQDGVFHGIESIYDLAQPDMFASLWAYVAGHVQGGEDGLPDGWLRYAQPSDDGTKSRWPVHPAWSVVQAAFCTETEPAVNVETGEVVDLPISPLAVLIRKRQIQANERRLALQVGGCLSTLGSWVGIDGFLAVCAWLVHNLPAYALPGMAKQAENSSGLPDDRLLKLYKQEFMKNVQDKRALYESLQVA